MNSAQSATKTVEIVSVSSATKILNCGSSGSSSGS